MPIRKRCRSDGYAKQQRNNESQEYLAIATLCAMHFLSIHSSHHHQFYHRSKDSLGEYHHYIPGIKRKIALLFNSRYMICHQPYPPLLLQLPDTSYLLAPNKSTRRSPGNYNKTESGPDVVRNHKFDLFDSSERAGLWQTCH